jgi:hypothetical protein
MTQSKDRATLRLNLAVVRHATPHHHRSVPAAPDLPLTSAHRLVATPDTLSLARGTVG